MPLVCITGKRSEIANVKFPLYFHPAIRVNDVVVPIEQCAIAAYANVSLVGRAKDAIAARLWMHAYHRF